MFGCGVCPVSVSEQNFLRFFVSFEVSAKVCPGGPAFDEGGAGGERIQPTGEMRLVCDVLLLGLPVLRPGPNGDVRDGQGVARNEIMVCKLAVQHAVKAANLIAVAVLRIGKNLRWVHHRGVGQEMVGLPRHRANAAHLPHQPFVNGNAPTLGGPIKLPGFAGKVLQDRAGFED